MRGVGLTGVLASVLLCTAAMAAQSPWQGTLLEDELTLDPLGVPLVLLPTTRNTSVMAWAQGMSFDEGLDLGEDEDEHGEPDVSDLEDDEDDLELIPLVAPPPLETEEIVETPDPVPAPEEGGSILGTWWFWTIVAVLAAGGGGTAVALSGPEIVPPSGTLGTLDTRN